MEFDPETALEQAMRLFWRKGYESTSLQDLLDAMQISKSSFYQTFRSKHELFQSCIKLHRDQMQCDAREKFGRSGSGHSFITDFLHGIATEVTGPRARLGCFLMNTATEFSQRDPIISQLVRDGIEGITNIFEEAIRQAQKENSIDPTQDPRVLADYLVANASGLRSMVKAGADAKTIKRVADVALSALG